MSFSHWNWEQLRFGRCQWRLLSGPSFPVFVKLRPRVFDFYWQEKTKLRDSSSGTQHGNEIFNGQEIENLKKGKLFGVCPSPYTSPLTGLIFASQKLDKRAISSKHYRPWPIERNLQNIAWKLPNSVLCRNRYEGQCTSRSYAGHWSCTAQILAKNKCCIAPNANLHRLWITDC